MSELISKNNNLLKSLIGLIDNARRRVALTVNFELTILYWEIGNKINRDILQHKRADYGKQVLSELSKELTKIYDAGFSKRNLRNFMRINEVFPDIEIVHSLSALLTWTHLRTLIFIEDDLKREFYIQMCNHERWSVRTLRSKIDSMLN
jgi:hypothetical protein